MIRRLIVLAVLALPIAGCHNTHIAPAPPLVNQVNDFDGQSFRALVTLQATLNSLAADVSTKPALAALKPALNNAITAYDVARVAWITYHNAATSANQTTLTTALSNAQNAISTVKAGAQ